ncbi:DUF6090 family protein [Winogradskyella maritima]|nr:DUF6090 family protein [Winogradskyella maritima]
MSENKTGRYFKYAIGEIILVVIGILIALGINNWNEKRQNRNEEKITLTKLEKDLTADFSQFNYYKQTFRQIDQLHIELYRLVQGQLPADSISEPVLIRRSLYFTQLVDSDFKKDIPAINNKKIDEALTKYTRRVKDMEVLYSIQLESMINNRLKPLLYESEVYNPKSWFSLEKKGFSKDLTYTSINGKNIVDKERFIALAKTNKFQQLLFELNAKWHEFNDRLDQVIEANENFKDLITSELKNY